MIRAWIWNHPGIVVSASAIAGWFIAGYVLGSV